MQSEADQRSKMYVELEIARLKLLFKKVGFDEEDIKNFIISRKTNALKNNNELDLVICERLEEDFGLNGKKL